MNPANNHKNSRKAKGQAQPQTTVLRDIREQLVIQNIKESHSLRERVPDVPRLKLKREKVYTFSRKFRVGSVSATSVTGASGGYSFSLSNLSNSTDFSNLFDQYRISQITVSFIPNYIQANVPLYTAFDYDDASTPPNLLVMFEKESCRISEANQIVERTFNPRVLREVYVSTVSTGYETAISPWIDSQNDTVQHYGFKYYIAPLPTSGLTNTYEVNVDMIIQGKNPT